MLARRNNLKSPDNSYRKITAVSIIISVSMPRSRSRATSLTVSNPRRGLIPGGSEQLKRYKILRRQQNRAISLQANRTRNLLDDDDSSNSDHSLDMDPDAEMQKVVNLCRSYTNDLYLPLRDQHSKNLVYSPLGYCVSTVMLHKGCSGACKNELSQAIFSPSSPPAKDRGGQGDNEESSDEICADMITGLTALLDSIKAPEDSYLFKHAYKLYIDKQYRLKSSYLNHVKVLHAQGVEAEGIDFQGTSWEDCATKFNQWAHEAGGKMLGEMVTKRSSNTKMIFLNPVYFMGNWVHPFNPALTQNMKFFLDEKEFVNVPMMKSAVLKNLLYVPINKLACKALVLPYKGDHLCLTIFLPNNITGLSVIEAAMDSISPSEYFQQMHDFRKKLSSQAGFQVYLPTFKIDCTLDLQSPMKEMGVDSIFQSGKADFSGLARNATNELCVTQMLQKVVLEVNEVGSAKLPKRFKDSSNTTGNSRRAKSVSGDGVESDIIEFRVDHPFYFQVVDVKSDLIVLAGMCKNPLHGKDLGFKEFLDKYDIEVGPKQLTVSGGQIKASGARKK